MPKSSISLIDKILSGVTTSGQTGPKRNTVKRYSAFLKALALLEPHHQTV